MGEQYKKRNEIIHNKFSDELNDELNPVTLRVVAWPYGRYSVLALTDPSGISV